jgi:glycosyltransferase involved in cell wall biosynthesis
MTLPKVSVSIVCYNQKDYIGGCLDSVLAQRTTFPYEVVVGDDCSRDGTREILEAFRRRHPNLVRVILQSHNVGSTQNYYDVVAACRGEYIAHLDGDDLMLPEKLEKQVRFLDTHPECVMVVHKVAITRGLDAKWLGKYPHIAVPTITDINYLVEMGSFATFSSKMHRQSVDRFPTRAQPTIDLLFNIEHASCGSIGYLDEVLGIYRLVPGTLMDLGGRNFDVTLRGALDAYGRALELGVAREIVDRGISRFKAGIALNYLAHGRVNEFRKWLDDSVNNGNYVDWRHRLVFALRRFPTLTRVIYALYRKAVGMGPLRRGAG